MTDNHPITVPAGSITGWKLLYCNYQGDLSETEYIVLKSAQLGADQELEACCEYLAMTAPDSLSRTLRKYRRPKPLSLKQQALKELENMVKVAKNFGFGGTDPTAIRRVLEQLDD